MEKEFCTFEISKKLKELGFDKPCLGAYYERLKHISLFINGSDEADNWCEVICAAPLLQQAITWLHSKNIVIEIQPDFTSNLKFVIEIYRFKGYGEFDQIPVAQEHWGYYRSYNEACQVAIEIALDHL